MKFHFSSSRGETKNNFSSRISRDRDSCQGLAYEGIWTERGANDFNNQYYKVWRDIYPLSAVQWLTSA